MKHSKWFALAAAAGAVALLAFVIGTSAAEAGHGGGFYWQGWYNWNGQWCQGLFNSAHQLVYYYCQSRF